MNNRKLKHLQRDSRIQNKINQIYIIEYKFRFPFFQPWDLCVNSSIKSSNEIYQKYRLNWMIYHRYIEWTVYASWAQFIYYRSTSHPNRIRSFQHVFFPCIYRQIDVCFSSDKKRYKTSLQDRWYYLQECLSWICKYIYVMQVNLIWTEFKLCIEYRCWHKLSIHVTYEYFCPIRESCSRKTRWIYVILRLRQKKDNGVTESQSDGVNLINNICADNICFDCCPGYA